MDNSGNKKVWIAVIIVAILVLVWWIMSSKKATAPVSDTLATADVNAELNGLDNTNLDAEFKDVDADLNQL